MASREYALSACRSDVRAASVSTVAGLVQAKARELVTTANSIELRRIWSSELDDSCGATLDLAGSTNLQSPGVGRNSYGFFRSSATSESSVRVPFMYATASGRIMYSFSVQLRPPSLVS